MIQLKLTVKTLSIQFIIAYQPVLKTFYSTRQLLLVCDCDRLHIFFFCPILVTWDIKIITTITYLNKKKMLKAHSTCLCGGFLGTVAVKWASSCVVVVPAYGRGGCGGCCTCSRGYHMYSRGRLGVLCLSILGLGGGMHFAAQVVCSHINICSGRQIKGHRACVLWTNMGRAVGPPMFHSLIMITEMLYLLFMKHR